MPEPDCFLNFTSGKIRRIVYVLVAAARRGLYVLVAAARRGLYVLVAAARRGLYVLVVAARRGFKMVLRTTAAATRGFTMVLFTEAVSRRNTFVGGTCAPPSALLVSCALLLPWYQCTRLSKDTEAIKNGAYILYVVACCCCSGQYHCSRSYCSGKYCRAVLKWH